MEQARYWTWGERKRDLNPLVQSSYTGSSSYEDSSWEEQAFAEDASGHLGGCIWNPRSYFCSFCRREFRSAQALGGHMNVHRRDRARLKQSSHTSPSVLPKEILINPHHHHHHHDHNRILAHNALDFHFLPQNCSTLASSPSPICDPSSFTSPSLKTSAHQGNHSETTMFPSFSSSTSTLGEQQNNKRLSPRSSSLEELHMVSSRKKEKEAIGYIKSKIPITYYRGIGRNESDLLTGCSLVANDDIADYEGSCFNRDNHVEGT